VLRHQAIRRRRNGRSDGALPHRTACGIEGDPPAWRTLQGPQAAQQLASCPPPKPQHASGRLSWLPKAIRRGSHPRGAAAAPSQLEGALGWAWAHSATCGQGDSVSTAASPKSAGFPLYPAPLPRLAAGATTALRQQTGLQALSSKAPGGRPAPGPADNPPASTAAKIAKRQGLGCGPGCWPASIKVCRTSPSAWQSLRLTTRPPGRQRQRQQESATALWLFIAPRLRPPSGREDDPARRVRQVPPGNISGKLTTA